MAVVPSTYNNDNGAQFLRPQGFTVFEKEIDGAAHDVVVVYVDGTTAIVVENKIADPYVINPMEPYTITTDAAFGEVNADNLQQRPAGLRKLSDSNRQLAKGKGKSEGAKRKAKGSQK